MTRSILLCTVGTSLLNANNFGGKQTVNGVPDWSAIATDLATAAPTDRACGAEVNSVASLIAHDYVPDNVGIYLFHSDTDAGRDIAAVLQTDFSRRGHTPVVAVPVPDLQDADPKRFRTKGLRNLAKAICGIVRERSAAACAINATGGYKAQIAIAVLLGQALGIPVYYMHERFSEIIPFPPLPVALDFQVWMRASGLSQPPLSGRSSRKPCFKKSGMKSTIASLTPNPLTARSTWKFPPLVRYSTKLSANDFAQAPIKSCRQRRSRNTRPHFEKAGWPGTFPDAVAFVRQVTQQIPSVTRCATWYYNP